MKILIDGNNLANRAMHANGNLSRKDGVKTGCVFTSLRMIRSIAETFKPESICIAWDLGRSVARKTLYPEYKANRDAKNKDELALFEYHDYLRQVERLKDYLKNLPVIQLSYSQVEADDIIAVICKTSIEQNNQNDIMIISADEDFVQLVSSGIKVYDPIKKMYIDNEHIKKKYNIDVKYYLFYKAMVGDKSDNIKGIKGFGPTGAAAILNSQIMEITKLDQLKTLAQTQAGKKFRDFEDNFEIVERNYKLVNLLDVAEMLGEDVKIKIAKEFANSEIKLDANEIFRMAYQDDFVSIFTDRNSFVKPFESLLKKNS